MFDFRRLLGKTGEQVAARFLKKNGCKIIEKNFRNTFGEIDIIASDRDVIVFVEVKTRQEGGISPKEAVTLGKQKTIAKVAESWLKSKNRYGSKARFDVIGIVSNSKIKRIEWVKNAFNTRSF
ncbi:MAG: YraN family protein [Desulfobacteraceae bacterium]|jgi:putative endonuclease